MTAEQQCIINHSGGVHPKSSAAGLQVSGQEEKLMQSG